MTRTIFLLSEDGDMKEMALTTYPSEDLLQRLLAEHPSVLSSVHTDDQIGHEWLLVVREAGVPDEEGGTGRWSLDHLFLDREGIPTLIEVKRSSDTRIRREVVGQMLDYAANSVAYRFHIRTAIPHHGLSATIPRIVRIPLPTRLT